MIEKPKKLSDAAQALVTLAATRDNCLNTKDDRQTLLTQVIKR
jgi:hypothetical protein